MGVNQRDKEAIRSGQGQPVDRRAATDEYLAVVDAGESIDTVGQRIFERLIEVASGDPTKSEEYGFGDDEFVPWQIGAVMYFRVRYAA